MWDITISLTQTYEVLVTSYGPGPVASPAPLVDECRMYLRCSCIPSPTPIGSTMLVNHVFPLGLLEYYTTTMVSSDTIH